MNPIADIVKKQGVMILDGALATELERRGCNLNDPLWSAKVLLEQPQLIKAVHLDYFAAGADCATTATYQATFEGFARRGLSHAKAADLMRLAVNLAVEARDEFWENPVNRPGRPKPIVAASVGSYGAFLADGSEYRGNYGLTAQQLADFHRPRLEVLAETAADILACETIPSFLEAQVLAQLLANDFADQWAWFSFSAKDGAHISDGIPFAECVAWLDDFPQIAAIGINCTPPQFLPELILIAREQTQKPVIVYPNSGEDYSVAEKRWHGAATHTEYGELSSIWYHAGAAAIGGCCRTTPDDIAQITAIRMISDE